MKRLSLFLCLMMLLSGCARGLGDIGKSIAIYAAYTIVPPLVESFNIVTTVYAYEKELQSRQPEVNIQNITISFNRDRVADWAPEMVAKQPDSQDKEEKKAGKEKKKPESTKSIGSARLKVVCLDQKIGLVDSPDYKGKFKLTIYDSDGKEIDKKIYFVNYFHDEEKNMPSAEVTFDLYKGDKRQKQETIYFEKDRKAKRWIKTDIK